MEHQLRGSSSLIHARIKPWAFSLDASDTPKLPEVKFNPIHVDLPKSVRDLSDELGPGAASVQLEERLGADRAVQLHPQSSKVRQMAGGAVYLADGISWEVDPLDEKLDALGRHASMSFKGEPDDRASTGTSTRGRGCSSGFPSSSKEISETPTSRLWNEREDSSSCSRTPPPPGTGSTYSSAGTTSCGTLSRGVGSSSLSRMADFHAPGSPLPS
jgi:hypothetical protein